MTDVCPGCGKPTVEPLDAIALAITPYCRDPNDARLAAKEACDSLVAHGYALRDFREEIDAMGEEHG